MQCKEENSFKVLSLYIISNFILKLNSSTENINEVYK